MPTKRTFDLVVISWLLLEAAWGLPKLWATRTAQTTRGGAANVVANSILVVH